MAKWGSKVTAVHINYHQVSRGTRISSFGTHGVGLTDIRQKKSGTGVDPITLDKQSICC